METVDELETERMRLAACGVAALSNTLATVAQRIGRDSPYWSASYGDVCNAVDREMRLRDALRRIWGLYDGGTDPFEATHKVLDIVKEALEQPVSAGSCLTSADKR